MPQHPDPVIRRAVRVLAMIGELHRRGYQKLRVMPFMSPSGNAWRCWIGPDTLFYRDHGAYLRAVWGCEEAQSTSPTACYTTGADHYFDWRDADQDDARTLADKFLARFTRLAGQGEGWSYAYAGCSSKSPHRASGRRGPAPATSGIFGEGGKPTRHAVSYWSSNLSGSNRPDFCWAATVRIATVPSSQKIPHSALLHLRLTNSMRNGTLTLTRVYFMRPLGLPAFSDGSRSTGFPGN
jgi:hypothetical protein